MKALQTFRKSLIKKTLVGKRKIRDNIITKEKGVEGEKPRFFSSKGIIHTDYVIAAGFFLIVFAFVAQYTISYFDNVQEVSAIITVRSEAFELLDIANLGYLPNDWPEIPNNDTTLVLLMHLNNNSKDSSGNGSKYNITMGSTDSAGLAPDCNSNVTGRYFSGCEFDGINDYIEISNSSLLNPPSEITVMGWVKSKQTVAKPLWNSIVSRWHFAAFELAYDIGYDLTADGHAHFTVTTTDSTTQVMGMGNVPTINDGEWHHIAGTYNGSNVSLYVDGVFANSTSNTGGLNQIDKPTMVGASWANSPLNGTIDEVALYSRALSAQEIRENYERGLKRLGLAAQIRRFSVVVNNSASHYRDLADPVRDLTNESVLLNFTSIAPDADIHSVVIYNESGNLTDHYIHGKNVTFAVNVTSGEVRTFTVYFSTGTVFPERTTNLVEGNNNTLNETIINMEKIPVLQYNNLVHLNQSNYTNVRESIDIENNFNILLEDAGTNETFIQFGAEIPRKGNIVSMRRFALYQNGTADILGGRLTIRIW